MRRIIPIAFILASLLYLLLSFSLEQKRMIGDELGWDPGPRALPLGTGLLMLGLSLYLLFKEWKAAPAAKVGDPAILRLIVLTLIVTVLYIVAFKPVGFILATALFLFTLGYFNYKQDVRLAMTADFIKGLAGCAAFTLFVYSAGKWVTRFFFTLGRQTRQQLFTGRVFAAGVSLAVCVLFLFLAVFLLKRLRGGRASLSKSAVSALTATGTTEILYICFKQLFLVSLASGLIFW